MISRITAPRLRSKRYFDTLMLWLMGTLTLLVGTDVIPRLQSGSDSGGNGPLYMTLIPIAGLILLYLPHLMRGLAAAPELSAAVLLCLISFFWSVDPGMTLIRVIPLVVTTAFALMLASMMSLRVMLIFMAGVMTAAMWLSLVFVLAVPGGIGASGPWEDTWNGIYNHKNGLGGGAIMGMLTASGAVVVTRGRVRAFFVLSFLLSAFMLFQSESRSSQIAAVFSGAAVLAALVLRHRLPASWGIAYIVAVVATVGGIAVLIATGVIQPLFDLIERQPTLSGRIPLWGLLWPDVQDRFWLGHGYSAFWDPESLRIRIIEIKMRFSPFYSHNGMMETLLAVGTIGFALIVLGILRAFAATFAALVRLRDNLPAVWVFLLLIAFLMHNITEASLLGRASLLWMFFVMAAARMTFVARALRRAGRRVIAPLPGSRRHVAGMTAGTGPLTPTQARAARARRELAG